MEKIFISFLVVMLFWGCNVILNSPPRCEINTPKNWLRKDSLTKDGYNFITIESPLDSVTNVKGFISVMMIKSFDVNVSMTRNIAAVKQYSQNFEEIERGEKNVDGIKAKWIRYGVKYKETQELELEIFFVPKSRYVFIIGCLAARGHLKEFLHTFNQVLSSFKIIN